MEPADIPAGLQDESRLCAIWTLWMCVSPELIEYPLLVADIRTVQNSDCHVHSVGSRHSVGLSHHKDIK